MSQLVSGCEICEYIPSVDGELFRTEYWRVVLAKEQAYLGRCYISLLRHAETMSDLTEAEWVDSRDVIRRVESMIVGAFGTGRPFNWSVLMNNAFQDDDPKPHVHWHVRPRHSAPVEVAGYTFSDPFYAHHYARSHKDFVEPDVYGAIFEALLVADTTYQTK